MSGVELLLQPVDRRFQAFDVLRGDGAMEWAVGGRVGQRRAEDEQFVLEAGDQGVGVGVEGPGLGPRRGRRSSSSTVP